MLIDIKKVSHWVSYFTKKDISYLIQYNRMKEFPMWNRFFI